MRIRAIKKYKGRERTREENKFSCDIRRDINKRNINNHVNGQLSY